jgi:MoaA/NifB/PqqE/SkfB family radical SAM enzyme
VQENMLSNDTLKKYNQFRKKTDKSLICHAPFVNLNFEQNGNMTACCYNRKEVLGRYPETSILEAWTGKEANTLRNNIRANDLRGGCASCAELLLAGNYAGTKALMYDEYAPSLNPLEYLKKRMGKSTQGLPRVFELELSNTCNLECEMCTGYYSSTIRKNREQLPPLAMVYDTAFVKQLSTFMPGLTDMKFLGGEPFLIDLYYDIWEEIIRINPDIRVHITTNGTILNQRAKNILEQLKVGIILSMDSLNPETYAQIRVGAGYERVMQNLFYFKELTKARHTDFTIAACPMVSNWQGLPDLLSFTNKHDILLHFNVVWSPEQLSLKSLPETKLSEVVFFLENSIVDFSFPGKIAAQNKKVYTDLVETLKYWRAEKESQKDNTNLIYQNALKWLAYEPFSETQMMDETVRLILAGIVFFEYNELSDSVSQLTGSYRQPVEFNDLKEWLVYVKNLGVPSAFSQSFLEAMNYLHGKLYQEETDGAFSLKVQEIQEILNKTTKQEQLAYELTETPPLSQIAFIHNSDMKQITQVLLARYT